MEVKRLAFEQIEVGKRLRDLDTGKVDRMRISLATNGLLQPIEVRGTPAAAKPYELVFGLHRLKAAEMERFDGIDAIIYAGPEDEASLRLREIDENLARAELSPYDQATFIAERAKLWVAKNGPIKPGVKKNRQNVRNSFIADTCEKFGIPEREIHRSRAIFEGFRQAVWEALRGTPVAHNATQLLQIKGLSEEGQDELLDRLRPSFELPRAQFNRAFRLAYASIKGLEPGGERTPEQVAEAMARAYRSADVLVQRLFRQKTGLATGAGKTAARGARP